MIPVLYNSLEKANPWKQQIEQCFPGVTVGDGEEIGRAQRTFRTVKTRYDIFLMNICLYTYAKTHGMLR